MTVSCRLSVYRAWEADTHIRASKYTNLVAGYEQILPADPEDPANSTPIHWQFKESHGWRLRSLVFGEVPVFGQKQVFRNWSLCWPAAGGGSVTLASKLA